MPFRFRNLTLTPSRAVSAPDELTKLRGPGGRSTRELFKWVKKQTVDVVVSVRVRVPKGCNITAKLVLNPSFARGKTDGDEPLSEDECASEDEGDQLERLEKVVAQADGIVASKHGITRVDLHTDELIPREARYCIGLVVLRADNGAVLGRVDPGSLPFSGIPGYLTGPGSIRSDSWVYAKMSARTDQSDQQPHAFLVGSPGTGKSTAVNIVIRELFGPAWDTRGELTPVLKVINASNVSRGKLQSILHDTMNRAAKEEFAEYPWSVIILEEMTAGAHSQLLQDMLRRPMESGSKRVRFIFTGNYDKCLVDALQSRVVKLRFPQITEEQDSRRCILDVLQKHYKQTQIRASVSDKAITELHRMARGDMRRLIQLLQMSYLSAKRDGNLGIDAGYDGNIVIDAGYVLEWDDMSLS